MKNAWKISGWYLLGLGIVHNTVGVILTKDILRIIWEEGLINSVREQVDRNFAFWFLFVGFFFIYVGLQWQGQIKKYGKPLSKFSAWGLTIITILGAMIEPISGFWLIMPLCYIMLYPHYFGAKRY